MKMYSDCSGECAICSCGDICLAGHGDDDFTMASAEQIIKRLQENRYPIYRELMVNTLKNRYSIKYEE